MSSELIYAIGVDGGGTKSNACLMNNRGEVLAKTVFGPTNFREDALPRIVVEIKKAASELLKKSALPQSSPLIISVCLSGLGREPARIQVRKALEEAKLSEYVFAGSDAAATLHGAFGGKPGMILIAGTGSIAFAKLPDGKTVRRGGWGYLLGDEGGGYDLGRQALIYALKDFDGRGEKTALRERLETFFQVGSIDEAVGEIYSKFAQRGAMAQFAPIVFSAAENGDAVARRIIQKGVSELVSLVAALCQQIPGGKRWPLALYGNLFKNKTFMSEPFANLLVEKNLHVKIVPPKYPPEIGAAMLGFESLAHRA